jgi:putative chitinase
MASLKVIDKISDDPKKNFTYVKVRPDQAANLKPHELIKFAPGKALLIADNNIFEDKGGHFKVLFKPAVTFTLKGVDTQWTEGYIYGSHWSGISAVFKAKTEAASRFSAAGSSIVLQPTPLLIQNDNAAYGRFYGGNTCGQTSLSMMLATIWPNAKVKQLADAAEGGQFENWVGKIFQKIGAESTSMEGHVAVLKELGIKATARRDATIADLKQALHKHPVVQGYAYKVSGHFCCAVGVADAPGDLPEKWPVGKIDQLIAYPQDIDKAGVIFNCPYGHRDFSGSGNNWFDIAQNMTDAFGLHNVATNDILNRFWVDGGEESGWAVFVDPSTPNAGNDKEPPVQLAATAKPAAAASTPKSEAIGKAIKAMAHPDLPSLEINQLIAACSEWLPKYEITTRARLIHFFATVAHESGGFYWLKEQGDEAYFSENYEWRDDLGNNQAGDGAKFAGRGLVQVTGRSNYVKVAKATGMDCLNNPSILAEYPGALIGSLVWWKENDMNALCDKGLDDEDVKAVCKRVNGGTKGLNDRLNRSDKLKLIIT